MRPPRALMDEALKATVVPVLRRQGFTGLYPHFRRELSAQVDLLMFQFDINGGGFVLEVSRCSVGGLISPAGKHIPASQVRVWDVPPKDRHSVALRDGAGTANWFRYEDGHYDRVANDVLARLPLAQAFWSRRT